MEFENIRISLQAIISFALMLSLALRDLFHPEFLMRAISSLVFVVAISMAHENGDNKCNKDQRGDRTYKEFWMKQTL